MVFDIDLDKKYNVENVYEKLDNTIKIIKNILKIEPDANVKIVDRSRESKYSFHVVITGFIVKRV